MLRKQEYSKKRKSCYRTILHILCIILIFEWEDITQNYL